MLRPRIRRLIEFPVRMFYYDVVLKDGFFLRTDYAEVFLYVVVHVGDVPHREEGSAARSVFARSHVGFVGEAVVVGDRGHAHLDAD